MIKSRTIIIAEAGVNHNGNSKIIEKLIKVASQSKADFIKFQLFISEKLVIKNAKVANYQKKNTKYKYQIDLLKKLELSDRQLKLIISFCKKYKIQPLFTPFDIDSLKILSKLNQNYLKISSSDVNNTPFLREIARMKKTVFLSTGMSTIKDIKLAVNTLIKNGQKKNKLYVLHCNTDYPTSYKDVNLNAMISIKNKLKIKVGYSDHSLGIEVPIAAVALGANIIEKHFTLDKKMTGPDHKASLNPEELAQMIKSIRNIETSFGSSVKKITKSELKNYKNVRKSIYANKIILKGEKFTADNLIVKRPATGIPANKWDNLIGKISNKNYRKHQKIDFK